MKKAKKTIVVPRNHVLLASMKRAGNGAGWHSDDTKYKRKDKYPKDMKNSKNWNAE